MDLLDGRPLFADGDPATGDHDDASASASASDADAAAAATATASAAATAAAMRGALADEEHQPLPRQQSLPRVDAFSMLQEEEEVSSTPPDSSASPSVLTGLSMPRPVSPDTDDEGAAAKPAWRTHLRRRSRPTSDFDFVHIKFLSEFSSDLESQSPQSSPDKGDSLGSNSLLLFPPRTATADSTAAASAAAPAPSASASAVAITTPPVVGFAAAASAASAASSTSATSAASTTAAPATATPHISATGNNDTIV